jgi:hypothetical protein
MKKVMLVALAILGIPFIIWNLTFGFYAGFLLLVIFGTGLFLSFKSSGLKPVLLSILLSMIVYLLMLPVTMTQMNKKTAVWQERVSNGSDLTTFEKFNIYGQMITASVIGLPFAPEASGEFMLMMFPAKNNLREFNSDFFMDSQKIQDAFKKGDKGTVRWYQKHYNILNTESRTALALNICNYKVEQTGNGTKYTVSSSINFPKRCRSYMLQKPLEIRLEEGLFRYLVDEGWLFDYTAVWSYTDKAETSF